MGVGKTGSAIYAMDLVKATRGIIICPAMLRENWVKELKAFSQIERNPVKIINVHDFVAWQRGRFDTAIMSYEAAVKFADKIQTMYEIFQFIHMDEAHYMKNGQAARSLAVLGKDADGQRGILKWALQSFHITGTVMPNDPVDEWTFLRFARKMELTRSEFIDRYLEPEGKSQSRFVVRPGAEAELQSIMRSASISRSMEDVGLQIPHIHLTETTIEGDTQEIKALLMEHPNLEQAIVEALEMGGLQFLNAQYVATLRRLIGKSKAYPFADMLVDEVLTLRKKQVVYGVHTEALRYLHGKMNAAHIDSVLVTGETPDGKRQEAVERFQNDPKCMVFVGNMMAAGTGITLTASHHITMFENNWRPADVAQAIKRVHRVGQTEIVRARFITLAQTIDDTVNSIVRRKAAEIAKIETRHMIAAPERG